MNIEMTALHKAGSTLIALVWLLSAVQSHVQSVAVDVHELGVANDTVDRLLVCLLAVPEVFLHAREHHLALVTFESQLQEEQAGTVRQ